MDETPEVVITELRVIDRMKDEVVPSQVDTRRRCELVARVGECEELQRVIEDLLRFLAREVAFFHDPVDDGIVLVRQRPHVHGNWGYNSCHRHTSHGQRP